MRNSLSISFQIEFPPLLNNDYVLENQFGHIFIANDSYLIESYSPNK